MELPNDTDMSDSPYEACRSIILSFGDITKGLEGREFASKNEAVMFNGTIMKLWQHGISSLKLCDEPFSEQFPDHRDYASASVIGRAVIESAGILKYLFYSDMPDDERQFILDYMEMRSIMVQVEYAPNSPELIEKYEGLRQRVIDLQSVLGSNPKVQAMRSGQRRKLLDGREELFTKSSLPLKLGFGPRAARYYRYLSDYTHNGYVAALQTSQPDEALEMARASLQPVALAFSYLIDTFYSHSATARSLLDNDEKLRSYVVTLLHWGNGEEPKADEDDTSAIAPA